MINTVILETHEFKPYFQSFKLKFRLYFSAILVLIFFIAPIFMMYFIFKDSHRDYFFLFIVIGFFIVWYVVIFTIAQKTVYYLYLDTKESRVKFQELFFENVRYIEGRRNRSPSYELTFKDKDGQRYYKHVYPWRVPHQNPQPVKIWLSYHSEIILKMEFLESGYIYSVNNEV